MIKKWLRELFGVEELQRRINRIEEGRADLEARVINADETRKFIKTSVEQAELTEEMKNYLTEVVDIELTENSSNADLIAMKAAQVVERYGFKRFVPAVEQEYPTQVISLRDLQQHPERYIHKLSKGFMGFPIGLNFDSINKVLKERFGNCEISTDTFYSNNGVFEFTLNSILGYCIRSDISEILAQATELSDLKRNKGDNYIFIDSLDFLTNYEGLRRFILEIPHVDEGAKYKGVCAIEAVRFAYLTALEIIGTTRIKDSSELLYYQREEAISHEKVELSTKLDPNHLLKRRIKDSLLSQIKGTSYEEIQKLLPIRSREIFRRLASERTSEILSKDKERRGLTYEIGKSLNDYSIGESIILACYFGRNIIQHYEILDDAVKVVLSGGKETKISGKCTDYTGLALHYLREYITHLHPEKFENWFFGFDADKIGDYDHCYMKIVHINPNQTVDVYFLDPTKLANEGIKAFKTPEKITKMMDMSKYPILIKRDAEDLLYRPIE